MLPSPAVMAEKPLPLAVASSRVFRSGPTWLAASTRLPVSSSGMMVFVRSAETRLGSLVS